MYTIGQKQVSTRSSKLETQSSCLEGQMLQDARIESRVLMIEDPEARLLREIIFVF